MTAWPVVALVGLSLAVAASAAPKENKGKPPQQPAPQAQPPANQPPPAPTLVPPQPGPPAQPPMIIAPATSAPRAAAPAPAGRMRILSREEKVCRANRHCSPDSRVACAPCDR